MIKSVVEWNKLGTYMVGRGEQYDRKLQENKMFGSVITKVE